MSLPPRCRQTGLFSARNRKQLARGVGAVLVLLTFILLLDSRMAHQRGAGQGAIVLAATEEVLTLPAQRDTYVDQNNPSTNYGNNTAVNIWRESGTEAHALLYFDTSALPAGASITSATLDVYSVINLQAPEAPGDVVPIRAEAVLSSWTETGVTWNNRPPSNYLNDPPVLYQQEWLAYDVTNIVQAWADGTVDNHGIKLAPHVGDPSDTAWAFFLDRSHATTGPRLTITYEEAPPPCTPVSSVTIGGPNSGQTATSYSFGATVSPAGATLPLSYSWSATGQSGSSNTTATYSWNTAGAKTVWLTVENCGGSVSDTHTVTIETPAPECEVPLSELSLHGPTGGATGRTYLFSAVAGPTGADAPVTFTWQATGQDEATESGSSLSSDQSWSWSGAGSKQISVTAENCGASFTRHMTIDVVQPSVLPDLTLGAPWYDAYEGVVGYILHNQGQNPAPAGHVLGLYNNAALVASANVTTSIPGGGVRAGQFDAPWSCGWNDARMTIIADKDSVLEEGNENNNEYTAIWPCDLRAPTLLNGPTVAEVTAVTARIEWEADELSTGWLAYGLSGYGSQTISSGASGTTHSVTLGGLQPATTYRMRAFVQDESGNEASSQWLTFETNTPGTDPPAVTNLNAYYLADHDYDTYTFNALVDDASYVDRVEFYLDGAFVDADYSAAGRLFAVYVSPPQAGFTASAFFDNAHTLEARVYGTNGLSTVRNISWQPPARPAPVMLQFVTPAADEALEIDGDRAPQGTTLEVAVTAIETDWKCHWGASVPNTTGLQPVDCASANPRPVKRLRLFRNASPRGVVDPATEFNHSFDLDLTNIPLGTYTLRVDAEGSDGEVTRIEQPLRILRGEADFSYQRSVTRHDNAFEIRLSVTNTGNATARIERLRDTLYGFQVIHRDHLPGQPATPDSPAGVGAWYTVRTTNTGYHSTVLDIDVSSASGDFVRVPPGETLTVFYYATPILYKTLTNVYRIGAKTGDIFHFVSYRDDYNNAPLWTDEFYALGANVEDAELGGLVTLHQSVMAAIAEADYLIVTSPYGLAVHAANTSWANVDPLEERERLYSDMAELARLADGAIAYYSDPYAFNLDKLLEPNGYWYESLHPDFRQTLQGYVLIVGEREVIPAMGGGYDVPWSDLRYASTSGDARPELVLGRLIGDDVATLRQPLDAAIRYHRGSNVYDHSHALLYAGRGDGESAFWGAVQSIDGRLPDSTAVTRVRSESINTSQEVAAFLNNTTNRDIIVYRGHGYNDGNGFAISDQTGISPGNITALNGFGNTRPFMFAIACSAGDYEADDDFGIAEASLREGASVFIGSTTLSHRYRNNEAARWFFNRFNTDRSIGDVFYDLLRDKFHQWSAGDDVSNWTEWGRWAYQYQLFGDPKFGRLNRSAAPAPAPMSLELPGSNQLALDLGDLQIVQDDGWHIINLPDGGQLQAEGQYMVPVQQVIAHYAPGVRVQDVQLAQRGGLEVHSDLNIPVSVFLEDAHGVLEQVYSGPTSTIDGPNAPWYPQLQQPFTWRVSENEDGSSELLLQIYPFFYDPATTAARYYRDWTFDVMTVQTDVSAGHLQLQASAIGLGRPLQATMTILNEGQAQGVIVSPVIRTLQGVEAAGLPLQTLHGVRENATVTLDWDSDGLAAGDYVLEVVLLDEQGHELDKAQAWFTVGLVQSEAVSITAGPYPSGGAGVPLALTVRNSGDMPVDGTLRLRVEDAHSGEVLAVFGEEVVALAAGHTQQMNVVWNDGAVPPGDYRVVGFMHYNGTVTEALVHLLGERIYLPIMVGGH